MVQPVCRLSVYLAVCGSGVSIRKEKELISIKGVGQKVADCVLLFSLKRRETFPTDVWIKRVMEHLYFNDEEKDIKEIHAYAQEKWGKYCGYAQQYLFYYARSLKIGTDKEKKK